MTQTIDRMFRLHRHIERLNRLGLPGNHVNAAVLSHVLFPGATPWEALDRAEKMSDEHLQACAQAAYRVLGWDYLEVV